MYRRLLLTVLTLGLIVAVIVPAAAAPPEQTTDPVAFTAPDFANDLVIFVNTSREAYCDDIQLEFERVVSEWLEGGMQGPFPGDDFPPAVGFVAFPVQLVDTPQGVIAMTRGNVEGLHMELWMLDDPEDQVGVGACLDTDDANELFAVGTSTFNGRVTDFYGAFFAGESQRPTFIDHTQGAGVVTTPYGDRYDYSWFFHQHVPCDDGPGPRCEVVNTRLQPLP